jgi:predicted membrane-bound dolichyl-phosphate-mannose-protein mannosyltransferase
MMLDNFKIQYDQAMFTLSTILNLIISTIVFIFAARYISRAMADKGIPSGMVRGILVFFLASVLALFAGAGVSWISETHTATTSETK